MNQYKSESISNIISGLFQKVFVVLVVVFILYIVIDENTQWLKPDYSQPHEYLSIKGYDTNGESRVGNGHSYRGFDLTKYKDNFFHIGKGKCLEYMKNISPDEVWLSVRAFNIVNYSDIRYVKLQCVEFLGRDKSCEDRFSNIAKQTKERQSIIHLALESAIQCNRSKNIGKQRVISLEE